MRVAHVKSEVRSWPMQFKRTCSAWRGVSTNQERYQEGRCDRERNLYCEVVGSSQVCDLWYSLVFKKLSCSHRSCWSWWFVYSSSSNSACSAKTSFVVVSHSNLFVPSYVRMGCPAIWIGPSMSLNNASQDGSTLFCRHMFCWHNVMSNITQMLSTLQRWRTESKICYLVHNTIDHL